MDSVNWALQLLLKRAATNATINYYYPYLLGNKGKRSHCSSGNPNGAHKERNQQFRSAYAHLDEIQNSSVILYWGDFLHMAQYQRTLSKLLLLEGVVKNEQEATDYIHSSLFLSNASEATLSKSISFGGTVIFNTLEDEMMGKYSTAFSHFVKKTNKIWSRDVYSYIKLSHLISDYSRIRPGVDCALLIRKTDVVSASGIAGVALQQGVSGKIGVFFGRSRGTGFRLSRFAGQIANELGRPLYWLPWGDSQGFPAQRTWLMRRPAPLNEIQGCEQLDDTEHLLAALMHSSLIITDTYHVAVNAWNLGTPAICIGETMPLQARNVNSGTSFFWRDKRQTFFSMYDALDFFVNSTELQNWLGARKRIRHILEKLDCQEFQSEIIRRMHQHRDHIEAELSAELTSQCG